MQYPTGTLPESLTRISFFIRLETLWYGIVAGRYDKLAVLIHETKLQKQSSLSGFTSAPLYCAQYSAAPPLRRMRSTTKIIFFRRSATLPSILKGRPTLFIVQIIRRSCGFTSAPFSCAQYSATLQPRRMRSTTKIMFIRRSATLPSIPKGKTHAIHRSNHSSSLRCNIHRHPCLRHRWNHSNRSNHSNYSMSSVVQIIHRSATLPSIPKGTTHAIHRSNHSDCSNHSNHSNRSNHSNYSMSSVVQIIHRSATLPSN